jgi:integrase
MSESWNDAISRYDRQMKACGLSAATRELRRSQLRRVARDLDAPLDSRVTKDRLIGWLADQEWSPETRRSHAVTLRGFFRWLTAEDILGKDPTVGLPRIRCPQGSARPASEAAVRQCLEHPDRRVRAAGILGSKMGLRRGEIARARVEHIRDGRLLVHGKGGKNAHVPVHSSLRCVLPESGPIVPNHVTGDHLTPAYVGVLLRKAMDGEASAHQLRHRFATRTYDATHDLRNLQAVLRHSSLTITQRYVETSWDDQQRIVDAA